MRIRLLLVGKTDRGHVADGLAFYTMRIGRSVDFGMTVVPESRNKDVVVRRGEESTRILAALKSGERMVLLDERGVALTSEGFAGKLGGWRGQGVRDLVFVVGGAHGVDERVRKAAAFTLSLSPMTLPHQLVRVFFVEQLYRAFCILEGRGYHHA